ncbi:hypothetical protein FRX31_034949 [Thalictrum thalictroides]|uniref:Uncharacterized protein n=1 Tax=Thalictrum thalictroides TaxID=46969 RepID=A0A7J6USA3_THATH|nr:hypothetical protein FRX31_034949 [Thalictrum thalictroides]
MKGKKSHSSDPYTHLWVSGGCTVDGKNPIDLQQEIVEGEVWFSQESDEGSPSSSLGVVAAVFQVMKGKAYLLTPVPISISVAIIIAAYQLSRQCYLE